MKIQVHKNIFGFSSFLICITNKEIFVNGSFENVPMALVAMEKNSIQREELFLSQIKKNLQYEFELNEFIDKNKDGLEEIEMKLKEMKLDYSWLQILQVYILEKNNKDLKNNTMLLDKFYEKILIKGISI